MLKSHYRDYATAAFRLLAREGSADRYRAKIYNAALGASRRRRHGIRQPDRGGDHEGRTSCIRRCGHYSRPGGG